MPIQQFHDVTFPVDNLSRKLHIAQQLCISVILQSPFADAQPLADFLPRQVVFTVQHRTVVGDNMLHVLQNPVKGWKQYLRSFRIFRYQVHKIHVLGVFFTWLSIKVSTSEAL